MHFASLLEYSSYRITRQLKGLLSSKMHKKLDWKSKTTIKSYKNEVSSGIRTLNPSHDLLQEGEKVSASALTHCAKEPLKKSVIANNILLRILSVKSKQIHCNNNNKCITSLWNTYGIVTVFFKFICFFLFAWILLWWNVHVYRH